MKKIWDTLNCSKMPDKIFYPLLVACALLAMLTVSYLFYCGEPILERDSISYVQLMEYYKSNGRLPMVWYISSLPFILFHLAGMIPGVSIENGMFLVNNIAFGFSIVLTGMTAKKLLKNSEAALFCALIYSLFPKIIVVNASLMRESCGICFALATMFFFISALDSGKIRYFFFTAYCGLCAVFCRIELLELQMIIGIVMLVMLFCKEWKIQYFFRSILIYICGIICALTVIACLLGGTLEEYRNIPDIILFRCKASSGLLEDEADVPDYYFYQ